MWFFFFLWSTGSVSIAAVTSRSRRSSPVTPCGRARRAQGDPRPELSVSAARRHPGGADPDRVHRRSQPEARRQGARRADRARRQVDRRRRADARDRDSRRRAQRRAGRVSQRPAARRRASTSRPRRPRTRGSAPTRSRTTSRCSISPTASSTPRSRSSRSSRRSVPEALVNLGIAYERKGDHVEGARCVAARAARPACASVRSPSGSSPRNASTERSDAMRALVARDRARSRRRSRTPIPSPSACSRRPRRSRRRRRASSSRRKLGEHVGKALGADRQRQGVRARRRLRGGGEEGRSRRRARRCGVSRGRRRQLHRARGGGARRRDGAAAGSWSRAAPTSSPASRASACSCPASAVARPTSCSTCCSAARSPKDFFAKIETAPDTVSALAALGLGKADAAVVPRGRRAAVGRGRSCSSCPALSGPVLVAYASITPQQRADARGRRRRASRATRPSRDSAPADADAVQADRAAVRGAGEARAAGRAGDSLARR